MTEQEIIDQILALEAQVTQRRLREAALNIDSGWLREHEQGIQALREALAALRGNEAHRP